MNEITLGLLVVKIILCLALCYILCTFLKRDIIGKTKSKLVDIREQGIKSQMETAEKKHSYDLMDAELKSTGIKFRMGSNFTPFDYLVFRLLISLGVGILCMFISPYLILPGCFGGYYLVGFWFKRKDKMDNEDMIKDISQIFSNVTLQLKSNVFISDVIYECYLGTEHPRLKQALLELSLDINQFSIITVATENFRKKFNNEYINVFAKTIEQAQKTGSAVEAFEDMYAQIQSIDEALAIKEEKRISDICGVFQTLIFIAAILFVLYVLVGMLDTTAFF